MPINIVDPTVAAGGNPNVPASPVAGIMKGILGVYGTRFPTPAEQSEINYRNALTQKTLQENQAPGAISDVYSRVYNAQPVTQEGPRPTPDAVGPEPAVTVQPNTDQLVRRNIGELVKAYAASGHYGDIGSGIRAFTANAPGVTTTSANGAPSPVDMAMLGAGDAYNSTPGGMREHENLETRRQLAVASLGLTGEQKNRRIKIQSLMDNQGLDYPTAEGITDGIIHTQVDQDGNVLSINNASGKVSLLYKQGDLQPGQTSRGLAPGGAATPAPAGAAPAAPVAGDQPVNNPGNLRPVGATEGFKQYPTPQAGYAGLAGDLAVKLSGRSKAMNGQQPTLRTLISTYSPSSENNTEALIANASKRTGLSPDQPLDISHLEPVMNAIIAQEQGGRSAAPAATVASTPATPVSAPTSGAAAGGAFKVNRGDLGIDFGSAYGGGATAARAAGAMGAVFGNTEANSVPAQSLSKISGLVEQLARIHNMRMGNRGNAIAQSQYLKGFPSTEPDALDAEGMAEHASVGAGTAEDMVNSKLEQAVTDYASDKAALQNDPNLGKEERQYTKQRVDAMESLMKNMPPQVQKAFADATGATIAAPAAPVAPAAPAAPTSNLDAGKAVMQGKPDDRVKVITKSGAAGTVSRKNLQSFLQDGGRLAQ